MLYLTQGLVTGKCINQSTALTTLQNQNAVQDEITMVPHYCKEKQVLSQRLEVHARVQVRLIT